jgi:hypothetical protein
MVLDKDQEAGCGRVYLAHMTEICVRRSEVMRLVLIEWEDSHADGSWQKIDGEIEDRALVCRSVGWLVLDGEGVKVVAPHINEAEQGVPLQGCGIMTIPTRAVLRVTDLTQHDTLHSRATCVPASCDREPA